MKSIEKRLGAAYIRVSTEEQTELSPDSQLEEIYRYADREQIQILQNHNTLTRVFPGRRPKTDRNSCA
ncbi:MAG: recombinase family protein [Oscillospiraceae bacterium]